MKIQKTKKKFVLRGKNKKKITFGPSDPQIVPTLVWFGSTKKNYFCTFVI